MRIINNIAICLLIAFPLWAGTSAKEEAVGSLSGSSSSGKLQVEAFAGLPWVTVSKAGSVSEQPCSPAIYGSKGVFNRIPCYLQLETLTIPPGEQFTAGCYLDMSGTGIFLGGYNFILKWDTTQVSYLGFSVENEGNFKDPRVNDQRISGGELIFTEAVAEGDSGLIKLLDVSMQCLEVPDSTESSLDLRVISMSAARTYQNLLGLVDISPVTVLITEVTSEDISAPIIELTSRFEDTPDTTGPYVISTKVNDENLSGVFLFYRSQGEEEYHSVEMSEDEQLFSGSIPGQLVGTIIEYYIRAEDSYENVSFDPPDYESEPYRFEIIGPSITCDFNGDGNVSIADVISLLIFQRTNPGDLKADFNQNGISNIADAISLLLAMRDGSCPDAAVMLSSVVEDGNSLVTRIEGLTKTDIEYIERMMVQMNLTSEEDALFRLALYGEQGQSCLPKAFSLGQNNPNPFNPATTISYSIPEGGSVRVTLKIYDLRGRLVRSLFDELRQPGSFSVFWDGKDNVGHQVSSGVYLYRMQARDFVQTRKMVLLK